jgi:hypothetical protein
MLRLPIKLRTNTGSYVPRKSPPWWRRQKPYKSEQTVSTVEIASGSEKEPGAPAAHPGPGKWKTNLTTLLPPPSGKPGAWHDASAKRRAAAPRNAHIAAKPGSPASGRIGYSSWTSAHGAARGLLEQFRNWCVAGSPPGERRPAASTTTPFAKPIQSPLHRKRRARTPWLPERRRCGSCGVPGCCWRAAAGNTRIANASPRALAHRVLLLPAQAHDAIGQRNLKERRVIRLTSPRLIRPWEASRFGFHRCVRSRVPDWFPGPQARSARRLRMCCANLQISVEGFGKPECSSSLRSC